MRIHPRLGHLQPPALVLAHGQSFAGLAQSQGFAVLVRRLIVAAVLLLLPMAAHATWYVNIRNTANATVAYSVKRNGQVVNSGNALGPFGQIAQPFGSAGFNAGDIITVHYGPNSGFEFQANGSYVLPINFDGTSTPEFEISGSAPPPQNWNFDTTITNNTSQDQYYDIYVNGTKTGTAGPIPPGGSFNFHYSDPNKADIVIGRYTYDAEGNPTKPVFDSNIGQDHPNWYQDGSAPNPYSTSDSAGGMIPDATTDTGNIPFTDTSDLAKEDTLRKGFEALYNATQQGLNSLRVEDRAQNQKLSSLQNAVMSGFVNVNGTLVSISSLLTDTKNAVSGVTAAVNATGVKLDGLGGTLNTIKVDTSALLASAQTRNATLDLLRQRAEAYYNEDALRIAQVDSRLQQLNNSLSQVAKTEDIAGVQSKLDIANTTFAGIRTDVQDFNSQSGTRHSEAQQSRNVVRTAITDQTAVDQAQHLETTAKLIAIKDTMDAVQSALNSIKETVDGARSDANANAESTHSKLDGLGQKLETIAGKIQENTDSTGEKLEDIKSLLRPDPPDTSMQQSAGESAGAGMRNQLDAAADGLSTTEHTYQPSSGWYVTIGSFTVDLNPINYPAFADFATWFRHVLLWVITFVYCLACYSVVERSCFAAVGARQASSAAHVPAASSGIALAIAGAMTLALAAIPALFIAFLSNGNPFGTLSGDVLAGGGNAVQMGVTLAYSFIPLDVLIVDLIAYFIFRIKVLSVFWFSTTVVRFLVG